MPQPKKRMSATRSGNRRSHLALQEVVAMQCSNCKKPLAAHTVCVACGYYKGKLVLPAKAK
jgi:large subunit ribosomal protein L32